MEASRALMLPVWGRSWTFVPLAGAAGAVYALVSYAAGPAAVPLAAAGLLVLALGLWRLEYGLALVIVVTPFTENRVLGGFDDNPLVLSIGGLLVLLVLISLGREIVGQRRLGAPPMLVAALAFLATGLIGITITPADPPSIADALFLYGGLYGSVGVFLLIALFIDSWAKLKWILAAVVASGLVISIHAIWQYQTGDYSPVQFDGSGGAVGHRVQSTFLHPNQLAGFLVLMVPAALGLFFVFRRRWAKRACLALIPLALIAVLFTFSRGALVGLAAVPFLFAPARRMLPAIALALVGLTLLSPGLWRERIAGSTDTSNPEIAGRLDFWEVALTTFSERPLAGVGVDKFKDAYQREDPGRTFDFGGSSGPPESAHNLYLNTLAEQGVIGTLALAGVILAFVRLVFALLRSASQQTRAMGTMLLGVGVVFFVHNFFDLTFVPKTSTLFWALVGAAAAAYQIDRAGRPA